VTVAASHAGPGWFERADLCLAVEEPADKCAAVHDFWQEFQGGSVRRDGSLPVKPIMAPGRPQQPSLVAPAAVPRRRLGSVEGRAALVHAVAHIEFNAINLALDAVYRFRGMPEAYYRDWLSVADDEARHFTMLRQRLLGLGYDYGAFDAHNGLWEMAEKTAESCLQRMALVPRVLEARGLDVTPGMRQRLASAGDRETALILDLILEEEVRHVEIGTRWFRYCCEAAGVEPEPTFIDLLHRHYGTPLRGPFNLAARFQAGFTEREMALLQSGPDPASSR
jgi:uncharacterized ferritin-like protein (DUF455 family)